MLKFNTNKVKNPLLKQIGQIVKNDKSMPKDNRDTLSTKGIQNKKDVSTEKKINLDTLIEFIKTTEKDKNSSFISEKESDYDNNENDKNVPNINEFIELRGLKKNLSEIIDGMNIKRFGVLQSMPGKLKFYSNLSFLSSLSVCINDKFLLLDEGQQFSYLKSLKLYIYNSFSKNFYTENNYKELSKENNFDKLEVSKNLYNFDLARNEFLVISDIFHINMFIMDSARDKLFFTGTNFIPYKKNVFLLKKEDGFYEPLSIDDKFYVDHENELIQYLIENNKKVELFFKRDKVNEFTIHVDDLENYKKYLKKEVKLDINNKILERRLYNLNRTDKEPNDGINDYTENKNMPDYNVATELHSLSDSENELSDEEIPEKVKYDKKDLSIMKVNELSLIAKSLNINTEYTDGTKQKKKTKSTLIEEILAK